MNLNEGDGAPFTEADPEPYFDAENVWWLVDEQEKLKDLNIRKTALVESTPNKDKGELVVEWSSMYSRAAEMASECLDRLWDAEDRAERALAKLDSRTRMLLNTMSKVSRRNPPIITTVTTESRTVTTTTIPGSKESDPAIAALERRNILLERECGECRRQTSELAEKMALLEEKDKKLIRSLKTQNNELSQRIERLLSSSNSASPDSEKPIGAAGVTDSRRRSILVKDGRQGKDDHPTKRVSMPGSAEGSSSTLTDASAQHNLSHTHANSHSRSSAIVSSFLPTLPSHPTLSNISGGQTSPPPPRPSLDFVFASPRGRSGESKAPVSVLAKKGSKKGSVVRVTTSHETPIVSLESTETQDDTEQASDKNFRRKRAIANFQVLIRKVQLINAQVHLAQQAAMMDPSDPFIDFLKRMEERRRVLLEKWEHKREIVLALRERQMAGHVRFDLSNADLPKRSATVSPPNLPALHTSASNPQMGSSHHTKSRHPSASEPQLKRLSAKNANDNDSSSKFPKFAFFNRRKSVVAVQQAPSLLVAGQSNHVDPPQTPQTPPTPGGLPPALMPVGDLSGLLQSDPKKLMMMFLEKYGKEDQQITLARS